jgi:hypothetical protein
MVSPASLIEAGRHLFAESLDSDYLAPFSDMSAGSPLLASGQCFLTRAVDQEAPQPLLPAVV